MSINELDYVYEIIVIDDGSTDNTNQILKTFEKSNRIKLIRTSNNGVSAARNLGLKFAKGEYIQYLDSDDLISPNKISTQIDSLKKTRGDIAFCDFEYFLEKNEKKINMRQVTPKLILDNELATFTTFWAPPAALLFSHRFIKITPPWHSNLPIIQDARYLFEAARAGAKFVYTPGVMAYYRVSENSLSKRHGEFSFYQDMYLNATEIETIWQNSMTPERRKALAECYRNCAKVFIRYNYAFFHSCVDKLLQFEPGYIPEKSMGMHLLSKMLGYRNAEKVANIKRNLLK